jgi:DNA-binding NarL/FixJ family response regulator
MIATHKPTRLTRRIDQVAQLYISGAQPREIASTLGLTSGTVQNYLRHACVSMRLTNRQELLEALRFEPLVPVSDFEWLPEFEVSMRRALEGKESSYAS